jgi:hypothetical protein
LVKKIPFPQFDPSNFLDFNNLKTPEMKKNAIHNFCGLL